MVFASSGALQSEGKASSWQIASIWYYYDEDGILTVGKGIKGHNLLLLTKKGICKLAGSLLMVTGTILQVWSYENRLG